MTASSAAGWSPASAPGYRPCASFLEVCAPLPIHQLRARRLTGGRHWPSWRRRCRRCSRRRCSSATPRDHRPQDGAWALALGMFALASVALATGHRHRLGQRHLPGLLPVRGGPRRALARPRHRLPPRVARRIAHRTRLGPARLLRLRRGRAGQRPDGVRARHGHPGRQGRVRCASPGARRGRQRCRRDGDHRRRVFSAARFARDRSAPGHARLAGANILIALGTLVLSSGGLVQGAVGHDEAFTASLAVGITVIYARVPLRRHARW